MILGIQLKILGDQVLWSISNRVSKTYFWNLGVNHSSKLIPSFFPFQPLPARTGPETLFYAGFCSIWHTRTKALSGPSGSCSSAEDAEGRRLHTRSEEWLFVAFCLVFLSRASMDLLYQQGRSRELCTELKMLRINKHKEIRLKDYIFFSYMAFFSTCISVWGTIPPGESTEEPLHAPCIPLRPPLQRPLGRDWFNFFIVPWKLQDQQPSLFLPVDNQSSWETGSTSVWLAPN